MRIEIILFIAALFEITRVSSSSDKDHLKSLLKTDQSKLREYEKAVKNLITRVIDNVHDISDFIVEINPTVIRKDLDTFILEMIDSKLKITANSPVAAAWGFNYYLKYYANSSVYWSGKNINLNSGPLPVVKGKIKVYKYKYSANRTNCFD